MKYGTKIGTWLVSVGFALILAIPSFAQNRRNEQRSVPRPERQERRVEQKAARPMQQRSSRPAEQRPSRPVEQRPQARPESRPEPQHSQPQSRPQFQPQAAPQRENQVPRPYQPPAQGHHSGQWLNQHRELPLDQQKRALQSDPQFRRLPPDRQ